VDWQFGDLALCVTPGSKLENRVVMVISKPLVDPSKEVVSRYEEIQTYRAWLKSAKELRARVLGALGRPAPTLVEKETPP
jgi:hypothetical protein